MDDQQQNSAPIEQQSGSISAVEPDDSQQTHQPTEQQSQLPSSASSSSVDNSAQPQSQPQASSSSNSSNSSTNNNNNNNNNTNSDQLQKRHPNADLFSAKPWGVTPIRQDTPWELPPSPTTTSTTAPAAPLVSNLGGLGDSMVAAAAAANGSPAGLSHMGLGGGGGVSAAQSMLQSSRFDQPWRAPASKQHQPLMGASPFAMNAAPGAMQKSMLNSSGNGDGFTKAPGPATSIIDMTPKPFGMANNRSSTWSAFGPGVNESEPDWPKSTTASSGISSINSSQPSSNAFDLEYEPGKSWPGSMLMKGLDVDSAGPVGGGGAQFEQPSGIGTWSPIVKGARPGSKWDGDGPDGGRGDNGRFDDGTAIWGSPAQGKVTGIDWDKTGHPNPAGNSDKSRSVAGNNQAYRPQQSSSSTSLLMSSNTSPSPNQHSRNQQTMKQSSSLSSHNYDQVQQLQSNALSSQANQPNRGLGLSSNSPTNQQLKETIAEIQIAVKAGYLSPQILNQPMATVTLQLVQQILHQIKNLHQLETQASQQFNKPGHSDAINVYITKTKQNITNLRNQINAQQAIFLKQTQAHNILSRQPRMPNLVTGGVSAGIGGPALPPGISQSSDSFRSGSAVDDFHGACGSGAPLFNNFGGMNDGMVAAAANGSANSLGLSGVLSSSRFDQPWRAPASKQHQPYMGGSPFGLNPAPGAMQKSMLNNIGNGGGFAKAPGPASSLMDMTPKPFGMANNRSSTWSTFGHGLNEPEPEWPKTSTNAGGISSGNSTQQSPNAFDLVPEFEPGKPWRGSMLMKSVEDDPTMTPGSMARSLAPQRKTIWSDEILQ